MKKNVKANMEKKLQKKKMIEQISNKTLLIFSVALICEVVLIFLYSFLKARPSGLNATLSWFSLIALLTFVGLLIYSNSQKKKGNLKYATRAKNWAFFSLAVSICAFIIKANYIITKIFDLFKISDAAANITFRISMFAGKTAVLYIMAAVAIYVAAVFIYYNIKIRKIKKSK